MVSMKKFTLVFWFVFFLNSTESVLAENFHLVLQVNNNPTDDNSKECYIFTDVPQLSQSLCESVE